MSHLKAFGRWMWDARVYVLGLIATGAWIWLYPIYAQRVFSAAAPALDEPRQVEALTEESLAAIQQNAFEQAASWVWALAGCVLIVVFAVAIVTLLKAQSRVPYHYSVPPLRPVKKLGDGGDSSGEAPAKREEPAPEPKHKERPERSERRKSRPPAPVIAHDGGEDEDDDPESYAAKYERNRKRRT